jgi:hypothetical protein
MVSDLHSILRQAQLISPATFVPMRGPHFQALAQWPFNPIMVALHEAKTQHIL